MPGGFAVTPDRTVSRLNQYDMTAEHQNLLQRVERLERSNRRLGLVSAACLLVPALALLGWRQAPTIPDVIQTHKLEIVDQHGVPLVTLNGGRNDEGGAVTLRDKDGERRAWWTASPDGSNLGLVKERDIKTEGSYTVGMSVAANAAEVNLISPANGMSSMTVRDDKPRIELWGIKGNSVFAAPFKN
jgi:hypothetical protein